MFKNGLGSLLTLFAGLLTSLDVRCRLLKRGALVMALFAILGSSQVFAGCNISFTAAAGGQVTKSGNTYTYTFTQADNNDCDNGMNADGSGSGMGIYVDAALTQNPVGSEPIYPTTSSQASLYSTLNNVYVVSECCVSGAANVNTFRYTPPTGFSGTDTFKFYYFPPSSGVVTEATVTVTVPATGPSITSVSPASGPIAGGTSVTISGSGFTSATAVKFGSTNATSYNVDSATSITALSPAGGAGTVHVTVTTALGTSTTIAADQFTYVTPVVAGAVSTTVAHGSNGNVITLALSGGTATSVAVSGAASHGTATASGTSITYTPTASYSGTDSFSYTATNAAGTSALATVNITVSPPALAISPASGSALTGTSTVSYSRSFVASGGTAPYAYALVVNSGSMPTGLSFSTSTGVLSGTPTSSGAINFTVTATDSSTGTGPFTVSGTYGLTVAALPTGTITFVTPTAAAVTLGNNLTNTASSTLSGGSYGAISYSSSDTAVATVNASSGLVTSISVGTTVISATQAAVAGANAQATQSYTLTVSALPLGTLSFTTPTAAAVTMGGALTNSATSTLSGGSYGAISYSSSNAGVATVNASGVITTISAGSTVITATQAAVAGINAQGTQSYTLTVNPLPVGTVTFATPGSATVGLGNTLTNSASASLSGGSYGAISYSSANTSIATVNASTGLVTPVSVGIVVIHATQAAVAGVNGPASQSYTLTVSALPVGALSFSTPTSASVSMGGSLTNTASSTLSGGSYGAISYSSANTSVATVNASTGVVTPVSVGSVVITATQALSGANAQASQSYTLTVNALSIGTLVFTTPTSATVSIGATLTNTATSTLSGGSYGAISYSSSNTAVATVNASSGVVTPVAVGTAVITATQAAVPGVNALATQTYTVSVNQSLPVANPVNVVVNYGSSNNPIALNVSGTATSVAVASGPSHGTARVAGLVITYTPAAGYSGNDSFTYTATNAGGTSPAGTVSILVQSRPDPTKNTEVIGLLNAQVETAKRFGQTQVGNFQSRLEGLHTRSRALLEEGQKRLSRGATPPSVESTATSLTEFSSGTNTANPPTAGNSISALFSPRLPNFTSDARCQAGNAENCMVTGGVRPAGDGMNSVILGSLTSANTRSDWWPWPTLSVNGSSKDLLDSGVNVWSAGTINVGRQSESDSRFTTSGVSVGGDGHVADKLILGIGGGFGHDRQKIGSNGTTDRGDSYSLVVYGSYQPKEGFFIDGLVGYGHLAFDGERYVTATGDFAQSERNGTQWFSSLSGGYEYLDGKFLFSPYGRLDLIHTRLDKSAESGASTSNLTYLEQTSRSTKLSFGLRGETTFEIEKGTIKPSLRVEYQHEFAEPGVANMVYSDDLNRTVYQLDMGNTDRNTLVLGLGLDFALRKSWQTGLSYKFNHSSSSSTQLQSFGVYLRRAF